MRPNHIVAIVIAAICGGVVANWDRFELQTTLRGGTGSGPLPLQVRVKTGWQPIESGTAETIVEKIHADVFEMTRGFRGREAVLDAMGREELVQEIRKENLTTFALDFVEDGYGDDAFARVRFKIDYADGVAHAYRWEGTVADEVRDYLPTEGGVELFWFVKRVPGWAEPYDRKVAAGAGELEMGPSLTKGRATVSVAVQSVAITSF